MKNILKIGACVVCALSAAAAFAAPGEKTKFVPPAVVLSAGGGVIGGINWKDAKLNSQYANYEGVSVYSGLIRAPTFDTQDAMRQGLFDTKELTGSGGIFAFFDATYVEASAALLISAVTQSVGIPNLPIHNLAPVEYHYTITQLQFSVLGKYPFTVAPKMTVFPLLGATYQVALSDYEDKLYKNFQVPAEKGYDMPNLGEYWNAFWVKLGVGYDLEITEQLFLRGKLVYGLKLPNAYELRMSKYWKASIAGMVNGPTLDVSIGYKFANVNKISN
ncbi:MAG: hypothetical protein Ta2A_14010 [Treponemataceae bacterium]|nr:MAG: hypothetical protein Ta2A_14010 [Treponemataceae bacterium]